jgi:hypothetical protein
MLDLLTKLLLKTIDVLLKRADLKKDQVGPLRMYELYISLREIIKNAHELVKGLEDTISEKSHIRYIQSAVEGQSKELNRFAELLWGMIFYLEIFDRNVHDELSNILGMKFEALREYTRYFCKVYKTKVKIVDSTRLEKQLKKLEKYNDPYFFDLSGHHLSLDGKMIKYEEIDLFNDDHLMRLKKNAERNIKQLEKALFNFGDFIKANCTLNDLFPKDVSYLWRR